MGSGRTSFPWCSHPSTKQNPVGAPQDAPGCGRAVQRKGPLPGAFPQPRLACPSTCPPHPPGSATRHGFSSHLTPQLAAAILAIPRGGIAVLSQPHRSGDPTPWPAQGAHLSGSARRTPSPQCQRLSRGPPFLFSESGSGSPPPAFPPSPPSAPSARFAGAVRLDFARLWLRVSRWLLSTMGLQMVPPGSFRTLHSIWRCHNFYQTLSFGSPSSTPPPPAPDKWVLLPSSW